MSVYASAPLDGNSPALVHAEWIGLGNLFYITCPAPSSMAGASWLDQHQPCSLHYGWGPTDWIATVAGAQLIGPAVGKINQSGLANNQLDFISWEYELRLRE